MTWWVKCLLCKMSSIPRTHLKVKEGNRSHRVALWPSNALPMACVAALLPTYLHTHAIISNKILTTKEMLLLDSGTSLNSDQIWAKFATSNLVLRILGSKVCHKPDIRNQEVASARFTMLWSLRMLSTQCCVPFFRLPAGMAIKWVKSILVSSCIRGLPSGPMPLVTRWQIPQGDTSDPSS